MSSDPNIQITIASAYDPTGTNQAQAALRQTQSAADGIGNETNMADDLVTAATAASTVNKEIKSLSADAKKSGDEIKKVKEQTEESATAADRLKQLWASYKSLVSTTTSNIAKVTGAIGLMGLGITVVRGIYRYFTAESRAAHEKQAEALKAATEKCKEMQKALDDAIDSSKELAAAQAGQDRLDQILAAHQANTTELQKQLEIVRARAAVEMEIKGYGLKAERYQLENQKDRGEINEFQYTQGIRNIEDQESGARYAANLQNGMDEIKNLNAQVDTAKKAVGELQQQKASLDQGNGIALSEPQRRKVEAEREEYKRVVNVWDSRIQALEDLNLEWTKPYQEAIKKRDDYEVQKQRKQAELDNSDTWLRTGDHGGTYDGWMRLKKSIDDQLKTKNDDIKNLGQNIAAVQTRTLDEGKKHTAEQQTVEQRRAMEDRTAATKAADDFAIKEAASTLDTERAQLKESIQGLTAAAKSEAETIGKEADNIAEIAQNVAKTGGGAKGKEAQKFMRDFQQLASSGDLAGKQDELEGLGAKMEEMLNTGILQKEQYDILGSTLSRMMEMARDQQTIKAQETRIAEIDKKISEIQNIPTLTRNVAADKAGSQYMADLYSKALKPMQETVQGNEDASRSTADALGSLADGVLDTAESQRMAENAERLLQSQDAAARQVGAFLKTVVEAFGESSAILQNNQFALTSALREMESMRMKNKTASQAQ